MDMYSGFVFHLPVLPQELSRIVWNRLHFHSNYLLFPVEFCTLTRIGLTYLQIPTVGGQQCPFKCVIMHCVGIKTNK